uniref:Zinc metalloprotease MJ0392 n=1 Tax=Anthurium amnicola TaxID=1678845 RepID=A0A1D1YV04_9ARAE
MNLPASVFREHLPLSSPFACFPFRHLRSGRFMAASNAATGGSQGRGFMGSSQLLLSPSYRPNFFWSRSIVCQAITETEPESNNEKENEAVEDVQSPTSINVIEQENGHSDSQSSVEKNQDQPVSMDIPSSTGSVQNNDGDAVAQGDPEEKDDITEVAIGSPLPGVKPVGEPIRIPKATIDILKDQVFGFDTFFVTSQEPYESGVLFKGNLRGQAAKSFEKITKRMQDRFGDQYKLFLLINPEDDRPVAVVVPRQTLQLESTAVPEWFAAAVFGLVTVFTLLLRNVPALQSNLLSTFDNIGLLIDGLPGALTTALVLGVHEAGHFLVARDVGVKLGVPYFVPSWQTGSFGAITRIVSIVSSRENLLKIAIAGPLAGFSLGIFLLLLGFILPPSDGIGIIIDPAIFHESFLAGGIGSNRPAFSGI